MIEIPPAEGYTTFGQWLGRAGWRLASLCAESSP